MIHGVVDPPGNTMGAAKAGAAVCSKDRPTCWFEADISEITCEAKQVSPMSFSQISRVFLNFNLLTNYIRTRAA